MALAFKSASPLESVRFTAQVAVPNVVQGLFKRRVKPVRVATAIGLEGAAYRLMEGLVEKYGADPFYVTVVKDKTLVVTHPEDIEVVLSGSPSRFGSDPEAKRNGMTAFQPDALTLSRGDLWEDRRRFAEAVLATGSPWHPLAESFLAKVADEAERLLATDDPIDFDTLNAAFQRLTRRVVLGDRAKDDTDLSKQLEKLMAAGNKMPGAPGEGYDAFVARIQEHLDAAEPGSLAALVAQAPAAPGGAAGQVVHWLFAMGDTLPANLMRALALLATHPDQLSQVRDTLAGADVGSPEDVAGLDYLAGCIQEAMRLWPTTPMFGRVALEDVRFPSGKVLPAGTPVLVVNAFNHRQRSRVAYADRFAPEAWATGEASKDWRFNFFSNGPQGCPGAGLSIMLGQALVARLVAGRAPVLEGASLDPAEPLPYGLDVNVLRISLV